MTLVRSVLQGREKYAHERMSAFGARHLAAVQLGRKMWETGTGPKEHTKGVVDRSLLSGDDEQLKSIVKKAQALGKRVEPKPAPFAGKTAPAAFLYRREHLGIIERWHASLAGRAHPPTRGQQRALDVIARLKQEVYDQMNDAIEGSPHEPMLATVIGCPGIGKREIIKLLIELFTLLGWTAGVVYQCVAFQNSS